MIQSIFPMAVAIVAGLVIIAAILLVTSKNNVKASLAYILGIGSATFLGSAGAFFLADKIHIGNKGMISPTVSHDIQIVAIIVLIGLTIRTYLNRKKATMPKWISSLETISVPGALKLGLMMILINPAEIIIALTEGLNIKQNHGSIMDVFCFALVVTLLTALPWILYLLSGEKGKVMMPKLQHYIEQNSWMVSIFAYLVFIALLL